MRVYVEEASGRTGEHTIADGVAVSTNIDDILSLYYTNMEATLDREVPIHVYSTVAPVSYLRPEELTTHLKSPPQIWQSAFGNTISRVSLHRR